ncbi:MAG: Zn-ribbon domain-containing OB-fold protein [Chloroflexi bacterium]|nr:Zn-ribbon domain-containing OB-fold protein [Chloroflexota bacterium]
MSAAEKQEKKEEFITFRYPRTVVYKHNLGYQSKFAHALKMGRILATKCPVDGRMTIPPRVVCPMHHVKQTEWVDQGQRGKLIAVFKINFPMFDSRTGALKNWENPIVAVELEGGARIDGWCSETDPSKLKPGMILEAVWRPPEEREGKAYDILHWKPVE